MAKSQVVVERNGRRIRISILNDESFVNALKRVFNESGFVTWAREALRLPDNVNVVDVCSDFPVFVYNNGGYGVSLGNLYKALTTPRDTWRVMSWALTFDSSRDAHDAFPEVVDILEKMMYQITSFASEVIESDRKDCKTLEFTLPASETQDKAS